MRKSFLFTGIFPVFLLFCSPWATKEDGKSVFLTVERPKECARNSG